jgi:zinc transporter ZupT
MEPGFWTAFGTSLVAAGVTSLGIFTIARFRAWGEANTSYFMCFAAGVLISASFLHIVPESFGMNPRAPAWMLIGFLTLHLVNRFLTAYVCEQKPERSIGLVPMLGIGFHSLIDGAIYSVAFSVSIFTGYLATIGMVLHEFPEGIITYLLLLRGGMTERRSRLVAFVAAAASTPVGMLASWPLVSTIDDPTLGALLALSAGALIYVGATHLLPRAEQEGARFSLVALAGGVLVAVLVVMTKT